MKFFRGISVTLVFRVLGMSLGYFLTFLIARLHGSAGVGEYNLLMQIIPTTSAVLMLGLNTAVLRFSGEFREDLNFTRHRDLVSNYLTILAVTSGAFILLFGFLSQVAHIQFFHFSQSKLCLLLFTVPAFAVSAVNVEMLRGIGKLTYSEFLRSVIRPLTISFIVFVSTFFENPPSLVVVICIGVFVAFGSSSNAVRRSLSFSRNHLRFVKGSFSILTTSWPMMIAAISNMLLVALPVFYLDRNVDLSSVGLFSVSVKLSQFVSLSLILVNTVYAPQFANLFWNNKAEELRKLITKAVRAVSALALVVALILFSAGRYLLSFLGKDFDSAFTLLILLTCAQLVNAFTGPGGVLLNMVGGQRILSRNIVVGICLMSLALLSKPDLEGTTLIYAVTTIGINIANVIELRLKYSLKSYLS